MTDFLHPSLVHPKDLRQERGTFQCVPDACPLCHKDTAHAVVDGFCPIIVGGQPRVARICICEHCHGRIWIQATIKHFALFLTAKEYAR